MSYSRGHENSNLCTFVFGKRSARASKPGCAPKTLSPCAVRRCFWRASRGEEVPQIATNLGCGQQTVRDAIHDFNARGLDALDAKILAPQKNPRRLRRGKRRGLEGDAPPLAEGVRIRTSLWTLEMAAEVAFEEGLTQRRVSGETIRATLSRLLGVRWHEGEAMDHLSRPPVRKKKSRRDRLMEVAGADPEWAVGFLDEMLVEPAGLAHFEQLERGGRAPAPHPAVGRQRRSRAESHLLLRSLSARARQRRG